VDSRCLTLVIDEVYRGKRGDTAIAEITVFTALDFGNPVARVLKGVTAGTLDREQAIRALGRLGRRELAELRQALPRAASAVEQEVILRVLARLDPAGSAKLLAAAVPDATGSFQRALLGALVKVGDPVVPHLMTLLRDKPPLRVGAPVMRAVARIGSAAATRALLARLGLGPRPLRGALVAALATLPPRHLREPVSARLRQAKLAPAVQADLARLLTALVSRHPSLKLDVASLVLTAWPRVQTFEARFRFLRLMGRLGDPRFFPALAALARGPGDTILREHALYALARSRHAHRAKAVIRALDAKAPRVRRGAVRAWALLEATPAVPKLQRLARADDWPLVREAAIRSLARACPASGVSTLMALARQKASKAQRRLRRLAILGALRCRAPGSRTLLGDLLIDDKERTVMRRFAVRLMGERQDRSRLRYMIEFLGLLAKEVKRPRGSNEALAADLAMALGRLGDRRAVPALLRATRAQHLVQLRAAALRALGRFCGPKVNAAVARARKSRHRLVRTAAEQTARKCAK
jgi:HEAT repeat protein